VNSFRRHRIRVALLVAAGLSALGLTAGLAFARGTATRIGTGVVVIETNLGYEGGQAAGTGMVLTPSGRVLTNNHVINGATTIRVVVPGTARSYAARVLGYSVTSDVALLQLSGASNLKTVSTAASARLRIGQPVKALGNANGTGSLTAAAGKIIGLGKTITAGDEEGHAERLTGLIETDANVQPGDSGGPLLDASGRVVGMDTAASTGSGFGIAFRTPTSDAYAIPIGKALAVAGRIAAGESSATVHVGGTAFLGVEVQAASDGFGETAPGALIAAVVPGGPADSAGLAPGDVITAVDGRAITTPQSLTTVVLSKKPGAAVQVTYTDQTGASGAVTLTLGSGPPQ